MEFVLPLDKMTTSDKLAAMERLWEDLCRNPESVPSPLWHGDVLSAREQRVREGRAEFATFDAAKDRIRKSTK
ncbi:MAG: addiction module protein [Desulfobacterales bacterium]|nr:addiction module protein [Desulfobacterales bacterium]